MGKDKRIATEESQPYTCLCGTVIAHKKKSLNKRCANLTMTCVKPQNRILKISEWIFGVFRRLKYIKIFATGGTFDKEFNEINGNLFFKEIFCLKSVRNVLSTFR